jgi:hypothetical protein
MRTIVHRAAAITVLCLTLNACGQTWTDSGFAQVESGCMSQFGSQPVCACVRLQVENLIPAEQFLTQTGSEKLQSILADCQDGQPSDERTALGWWWDVVNYDMLGGEPLLTWAVGWELFLAAAPILAPIALVQAII